MWRIPHSTEISKLGGSLERPHTARTAPHLKHNTTRSFTDQCDYENPFNNKASKALRVSLLAPLNIFSPCSDHCLPKHWKVQPCMPMERTRELPHKQGQISLEALGVIPQILPRQVVGHLGPFLWIRDRLATLVHLRVNIPPKAILPQSYTQIDA